MSSTRSVARTKIPALGSTVWQMDFATRMTIQMLYLVEYANWDSQSVIGHGTGTGTILSAMGYTDSMPYHTGTTRTGRDIFGASTQYRYIEGLWDNCYDWLDGCYYNGNGLYIIKNPANFSDSANGTLIAMPDHGYPTELAVCTKSGFEWVIYPKVSDDYRADTFETYVPDTWCYWSGTPCLRAGGYYDNGRRYGLFHINAVRDISTFGGAGNRLMVLP